jgi:hypothetical protein
MFPVPEAATSAQNAGQLAMRAVVHGSESLPVAPESNSAPPEIGRALARPAHRVQPMTRSDDQPSAGALEAVQRLAGPAAVIATVARLHGGQHADTWRVDTEHPASSVVVRQFPPRDPAGGHEQLVLGTLDGLGGLAPVLLGGDLDGRWSRHPTSVISRLDGEADITPADPAAFAHELGGALALVHRIPGSRLAELPSVFDRRGSQIRLDGPLAASVRSRWSEIIGAPQALAHCDYWSGNVVWRGGKLAGIVDWSGGARGPCGYDVGWCRLDLVLLFDERIADLFLAAYEASGGQRLGDVLLWDAWAAARSHDTVETWTPNYAPLGRGDLDEHELRRLHSHWTARLLERT